MKEKMTIRPMAQAVRKYTYEQPTILQYKIGSIGYLRGDMGANGIQFFSTWFDDNADLKTKAFQVEFDAVINALRDEPAFGGILSNRASMEEYCRNHPAAQFQGNYCPEYGFRVDTESYTYLLRLNTHPKDYNFYICCYEKDKLDAHILEASQGIRFLNIIKNVEAFRIPDGDMICVKVKGGSSYAKVCRYIDPCFLCVGGTVYTARDFAQEQYDADREVFPLRSSLPRKCYHFDPYSGKLMEIDLGSLGMSVSLLNTKDAERNRKLADAYNEKEGITKAQAAAMHYGCGFSWADPEADPANYDDAGTYTGSR